MCTIADQIVKLCLLGGQVEHDLCQAMAISSATNGKVYGSPYTNGLKQAESILTVRGDIWALEYFHRIKQRLEENENIGYVMTELTETQSPGDTVNEVLQKAKSILT